MTHEKILSEKHENEPLKIKIQTNREQVRLSGKRKSQPNCSEPKENPPKQSKRSSRTIITATKIKTTKRRSPETHDDHKNEIRNDQTDYYLFF